MSVMPPGRAVPRTPSGHPGPHGLDERKPTDVSQVLDTPTPPSSGDPTGTDPGASDLTPAELAAQYGLSVSGARVGLIAYVQQLWQRRHFVSAFATAKLTAQYSQAKLGQVWQILTPLLNAAVYYFVFGVLMGTKRGVPDFLPFLVTGVFVFTFTQQSILTGCRAISGNLGLVRALHFPRAALPISFCIQQLQQLLFSMCALVVINLSFGVPVAFSWFLVIPTLVLQFTFNTGVALIMARLGSNTPDLAQLMPFLLRTWMYLSGVMWSISKVTSAHHLPKFVLWLLQVNPASVYISLMRYSFIDSFHASQLPPHVWATALAWALIAGIGGFIYFWQAEETYGRG